MVRQEERMSSVNVHQVPDYRTKEEVGGWSLTTLTGIANLLIVKPAFQAPNERMDGCRNRSFVLGYTQSPG